jgi:hypothetical protein
MVSVKSFSQPARFRASSALGCSVWTVRKWCRRAPATGLKPSATVTKATAEACWRPDTAIRQPHP